MASSDPRNVGLSKNCMEALVEFSTIAPSIEIDEHNCRLHNKQRACKNIKEFGRDMYNEARENVTKWCFILPQRARSEGK